MARRGRPPRASTVEASGEWQRAEAASVAYVLPEPAPISDADVHYSLTRILGVPVENVDGMLPHEIDLIRAELANDPLVQVLDTAPAAFRMRVALAAHRRAGAHEPAAALEVALHRIDELRNALPAAIEAAGPEHAPALRDLLNII